MTLRQRILMAIKKKEPDYVPCAPWHAIVFPAKVLGIQLGDLCGALATRPIWKATLATAERFNFVSDILSPLCIGGGEYIPLRDAPITEKTEVKKEVFQRNRNNRWVRIIISTPKGDLTEERICPTDAVDVCRKYLIEDPVKDYPKIRYLLPDPNKFDWEEHLRVQREVGESGIVRLGFDTPWTWWIIHRGPAGYTDYYDYPEILDRFYEDYLNFVVKYIEVSEKYKPDVYWVHGVFDGMVGPNILDRYVYPFIKTVRKRTDIPLIHFISGKISPLLEREAEAGVDVLEPLEPNPIGDVDLSVAKRQIGSSVCLKGNLDPISVLERGSLEDIEREVKRCIEGAAEGGGYIFSTADEISPLTPEKNVLVMAESVKAYGKY